MTDYRIAWESGITIFLLVFVPVFVFWAFISAYNDGFFDHGDAFFNRDTDEEDEEDE